MARHEGINEARPRRHVRWQGIQVSIWLSVCCALADAYWIVNCQKLLESEQLSFSLRVVILSFGAYPSFPPWFIDAIDQ